MKIRTYNELIRFNTLQERFEYAKLNGLVGEDTFGFDRYLNQSFYTSKEWRRFRDSIISRDEGLDLGMPGYEIGGKIIIHHLNPITPEDIINGTDFLMNPDYMICVSEMTHKAIHYGTKDLLPQNPIERTRNDTIPWKLEVI